MNQIDKNTVSSENQLPENEFITFDTKNNAEGLRVLFFGNSITRHGVKEDIGWHHDWGMAASAKEKDYVHLVLSEIRKTHPDASACICQGADWERNYPQGISCLEKFKAARDFSADIIVIRVIENCNHKEFDREVFLCEYKNMIDHFNPTGKAKVVVTTSFWIHPLDEQIRQAAQECGYGVAELGVLGEDDKNKAIGLFEHEGVANHPGDEGMKAIADAILEKLNI